MQINKLLNSPRSCGLDYFKSESPIPAPITYPAARLGGSRRHKVPKDAPIFVEGNQPVGHINFPPHEAERDHQLAAQHLKFQVYPLGEIYKKGIRHIPYNSDKKDFLDKTGRDAFEVFQYTYKIPGEEKEYVVVWDYNTGLVRITPFFKSLKYSKTTPAKALKENPGLKEVSYSITGGALVCQGYWFPFDAAKAIAATFCYDIRWALTPVFGNDFPSTCLHPKDADFARFVIEPFIVQNCITETDRLRAEGARYRVLPANAPSPIYAAEMKFGSPLYNMERTGSGSEYGSSMEQSDEYFISPQVSPRTQWTWKLETGSPVPSSPYTIASSIIGSPASVRGALPQETPTSFPGQHYEDNLAAKQINPRVAMSNGCKDDTLIVHHDISIAHCGEEGDSQGVVSGKVYSEDDFEAARVLMSLNAADRRLPPVKCGHHATTF